jgi:hypothetical protein
VHVVILYALDDVLDVVGFLLRTWAAILGVTTHSNEVEGVAASTDVLEVVEISVGEPMYFDHVEGDN